MRKKAALAACSDPLSEKGIQEAYALADVLREMGVEVEMPPAFFTEKHPGAQEKAECLSACFRDPQMDFIFDISGGDAANTVLSLLDYDAVEGSHALFCGYSDLTTVLNAINAKTGSLTANYQVRNLLYEHAQEQKNYFLENVLEGNIGPRDLECRFLRGSKMTGKIAGGNLRCFLKLAGTPYWPDLQGRILLLEAMGGGLYQMMTALEQYAQMGVFDQVSGVLLGTFCRMEREEIRPAIGELILEMVPERVPVAQTRFVGHYTDARAVLIGGTYSIGQ